MHVTCTLQRSLYKGGGGTPWGHAYSFAAQSRVAVPKGAPPGALLLLAKVPEVARTSYPAWGPGDPALSLNTLPRPNRGPLPTEKDRREATPARAPHG